MNQDLCETFASFRKAEYYLICKDENCIGRGIDR